LSNQGLAFSRRSVAGLDQGKKPKSSRDGKGQGVVFMSDIYDGAEWTEVDIADLKAAIEQGSSVQDVAEFLCRSGTIDAVECKARELGLIE
jgi:hypothetical protein